MEPFAPKARNHCVAANKDCLQSEGPRQAVRQLRPLPLHPALPVTISSRSALMIPSSRSPLSCFASLSHRWIAAAHGPNSRARLSTLRPHRHRRRHLLRQDHVCQCTAGRTFPARRPHHPPRRHARVRLHGAELRPSPDTAGQRQPATACPLNPAAPARPDHYRGSAGARGPRPPQGLEHGPSVGGTTLHANSAEGALRRLEQPTLEAARQVPFELVCDAVTTPSL